MSTPERTFRVWSAVTVFVQAEGDRAPWTKRSRADSATVQAGDYDAAMREGERQLAAAMHSRVCQPARPK